jgi:hypothetical protein
MLRKNVNGSLLQFLNHMPSSGALGIRARLRFLIEVELQSHHRETTLHMFAWILKHMCNGEPDRQAVVVEVPTSLHSVI